ncbi:DNA repair protein complementing XP-C cells isoform X2 [Acanthochromis polyacanthus]|uniref:DNA repair protein complementing XP-C cells isoform X2 n=1 Tax=Acanthochromis polyacanthus TaxID=80966 RepID=UPI002234E6F4|nr:DNA repair protein complementing XP-C cells isoform X2 [Acanthochromis polyacanthus]
MAKRRQSQETAADKRKPKQELKAKSNAAKRRAKKKDADNVIAEKEEKLERKVKPKRRLSSKQALGQTSSSKSSTSSAVKTSKYFQSPVKEEIDSEEDFDMETSPPPPMFKKSAKKPEKEEEEEEEEEDDWEEVEELAEPLGPAEPPEPVLPSQPVEIEIETPEVRKRQKRQAEFETYLRRMMNRYKKDVWIDTHKVHLMCLIASGMFRNRLCSEPDLLAITLSLLPSQYSNVEKGRVDLSYLSLLLKWFRQTFTLNASLPNEERLDLRVLLERRLASFSARNHQELTHLFLLILRSLQLFCRLVLSLQPIPLKPPSAKGKAAVTSPPKKSQEMSKSTSPKVSPGTKRPAEGGKIKAGKKAKRKEKEDEEEEKSVSSGGQKPKNSKRRRVASKVNYKEESNSDRDGDEEERLSDEEFQATSEEDSEDSERGAKSTKAKKMKRKSEVKGKNSKDTVVPKRKSGEGKKQIKDEQEDDDDDDDEGIVSNGTKKRNGKKKEGPGVDEWLEVYLEKTSSWVCVHVEKGVGMPHLCSQNATAPVTYVVSVDGDGFLKDLGRKYDPTWMTSSRKRRIDDEWWEETLEPFLGPEDERDIKEEKELQNKLLNKPLPISIGEYKNHPLYALKRHLLKYEAIYPPTATTLGYCRGEPVYSRDCVHTLHSRDTWLKEARTVRLGEEPYKMVKGFSNRSRKARMMAELKEENDLPLFGEWQTEEYQPPIAVDGKVPRNDYGNVYLFKPCMLPVGCVHVQLPNLHRVARKLNLDAAPAVTGFDFHGGYSHAVTDGYIVCEEHEEVLRAAWVEEQELKKQKEKEKKEKRVISNWTLLVKGLLIRERLKQRYGKKTHGLGTLAHGDDTVGFSSDEDLVEDGSSGAKTASETLAMSWPQNRQAEGDGGSDSGLKKKTTKREKRGQQQHLFPFEKL